MGCMQRMLKEMEIKYGADFFSGREPGPIITSVPEIQAVGTEPHENKW